MLFGPHFHRQQCQCGLGSNSKIFHYILLIHDVFQVAFEFGDFFKMFDLKILIPERSLKR